MTSFLETAFDKVFDTQQIYRVLLDTMARPGSIGQLPSLAITPPDGLTSFAAAIAFTLFDSQTLFSVWPASETGEHYITANTGAGSAPVCEADFIILAGDSKPPAAAPKSGTLLAPEQGATLIIMVSRLGGDSTVRLELSGPGIRGQRILEVSGLLIPTIEQIQEINQEFPLGVDMILTDREGAVASIPRSTAIKWR